MSIESFESNECKIVDASAEIIYLWDDTGESILAILELLELEYK